MKSLLTAMAVFIAVLGIHSQVSVQTNLPSKIAPNSQLVLEIKLIKGDINNFSKYQIDVPNGVTISEGDSKEGNFHFDGGRAKIVWVTTPPESEFIVSFKMNTGSASGPGVFNHKFYYLDDGSKQEVEFEPINVTFDPSGSGTAVAFEKPVVKKNEQKEAQNDVVSTSATEQPKQDDPEPVKEPVRATAKVPVSEPANNFGGKQSSASGSGLVYRVQIGAYSEDPSKAKFSSIGKVSVSKEDGFYKVLVGSFNSKEEAVSRANELRSSGYNGFIVTYQNGVRVK
jgi:cell division septation protein DedD